MGMFDKDKEIGLILQNWVGLGEPFIVYSARIIREDFPTELGLAVQAEFEVAKLADPNDRYTTTTLASAIASKVREAEPDDFPAVVQLMEAPSRFAGKMALVMQFLKPYGPGRTPTPETTPPVEDAQTA